MQTASSQISSSSSSSSLLSSSPRKGSSERAADQLRYPTLTDGNDIDTWLQHSRLIIQKETRAPPGKMVFQADDSSMDGTASSVGESAWDMIDEESVASEDVALMASQALTAAGNDVEPDYLLERTIDRVDRTRSLVQTDAYVPDQGFEQSPQHSSQIRPDAPKLDRLDLASDSPQRAEPEGTQATPVVLYPQKVEESCYGLDDSHMQDHVGMIRVKETHVHPSGVRFASAAVHSFDLHPDRKELDRRGFPNIFQPLTGKVHLSLKDGGLGVNDTFKLLYYGPNEMKSAITQKIGSALAANPHRPLLTDGPASSRVTVVPISSFVDESSPEVVMIESGGFDMIIEECIGARHNSKGGITLDVESGNTIEHSMEHAESGPRPRISAPTGVPDLGIIYLSAQQLSHRKFADSPNMQVPRDMHLFFVKLGIPYFVITDSDWLDRPSLPVNPSLEFVPHRSVEALIDKHKKTWSKIPIDTTNFLALDAGQLHQNLVALKDIVPQQIPGDTESRHDFKTYLWQSWQSASKYVRSFKLTHELRGAAWPTRIEVAFIIFMLVAFSAILFYPLPYNGTSELVPTPLEAASPPPNKSPTPLSPLANMQMSGKGAWANVFAVEDQQLDTAAQCQVRKKDSSNSGQAGELRGGARDPIVRVVGDSHILIRSSKAGAKNRNWRFESKRGGKLLQHQVQQIDDEYAVLELASADAFGQIELRIWSTGKPQFNETFEIDLGFPWLKVGGWKDLVGSNAAKALDCAQSLQKDIFETMEKSQMTLLEFGKSLNLLEQAGQLSGHAQDAEQMLIRGSAKIWHRSTREALRVQRRLGWAWRNTTKAMEAWDRALIGGFAKQTAEITQDLKQLREYILRHISDQEKRLHHALEDLRQQHTSPLFSEIGNRHLRSTQKRLLHVWWKVRGRPG